MRPPDGGLLRNRQVVGFLSARLVSLFGNAIAPVALAFAILELPGGSATELGLILTARFLAQVVFLTYGGIIADRFPRHLVMIVADVAAGVSQGAIAVLFLTGHANPVAIGAVGTLSGAATALFEPASRSFLPLIVEGESLRKANSFLRLFMNSGSILGAALAGVLVAVVGSALTLSLDAVSFLLSALILLSVRPIAGAKAAHPRSSLARDLQEGWWEFTKRPWIWVMVTQLSLANLCIAGGLVVLGPVVARESLGGAAAWGFALAAQATGFIVGSVIGLKAHFGHPIRVAAALTAVFSIPLFLLAGAAPIVIIAAGMFAAGLCIDLYEVLFETAIQQVVPDESLSKVMSYDSLGSFLFVPLGLAIAGPIATAVGVRGALIGAGLIIVASAVAALLVPAVWRFRWPHAPQPAGGTGISS